MLPTQQSILPSPRLFPLYSHGTYLVDAVRGVIGHYHLLSFVTIECQCDPQRCDDFLYTIIKLKLLILFILIVTYHILSSSCACICVIQFFFL